MIKKVLTKTRKKMIKNWLTLRHNDKVFRCPFIDDVNRRKKDLNKYCHQTCGILFPRTIIEYGTFKDSACPCDCLTPKYVITKAKQFVK